MELNAQEIAIADYIHVAEPRQWMYCFNCGQHHFHVKYFITNLWRCPNCGRLRTKNKEYKDHE